MRLRAAPRTCMLPMTFAKLFDNDPLFQDRRRRLRQESTKAEQVLWQELRGRKLGYKFRRQYSLGNCILDFYCDALRLCIELDGPVHDDPKQKQHDRARDAWLVKQRVHILRFQNDEALFEREKVLQKIQGVCEVLAKTKLPSADTQPLPNPPLLGEGA